MGTAWYDEPCFDLEREAVGDVHVTGRAWRRLQALKEAHGSPPKRVVKVAGTTFRPEGLAAAARSAGTCALVPEPTNEYDPNAVRVEVGGSHVGYVPRGVRVEGEPHVLSISAERPHVWLAVY